MNDKSSMRKLTVYLFLDENLIVGLILEKLLGNGNIENSRDHSFLINDVKKSKEVKKLIEELYNIPVKTIILESSLNGATEKVKNRKEFKIHNIDCERVEELRNKLNKKKYRDSVNDVEYLIRFNGICLYVVTSDAEKKYIKWYNKKYSGYEEELKRTFDSGDLDLIKTMVSYADKRNGRGIYIFLTSDKKIIKKFSDYLFKLAKRRIYILSPEDIYSELNNSKNLSDQNSLQELLFSIFYKYLARSLERNRKKSNSNIILQDTYLYVL